MGMVKYFNSHFNCSKAFSLVEAVVAGVIFSIVVVGVFSSMAAVKKPVKNSDRGIDAIYYGQRILETLRANVDARDWDTGSLSPSTCTQISSCVQQIFKNGTRYTASYYVTAVPNSTARQVTMNIAFPDL